MQVYKPCQGTSRLVPVPTPSTAQTATVMTSPAMRSSCTQGKGPPQPGSSRPPWTHAPTIMLSAAVPVTTICRCVATCPLTFNLLPALDKSWLPLGGLYPSHCMHDWVAMHSWAFISMQLSWTTFHRVNVGVYDIAAMKCLSVRPCCLCSHAAAESCAL